MLVTGDSKAACHVGGGAAMHVDGYGVVLRRWALAVVVRRSTPGDGGVAYDNGASTTAVLRCSSSAPDGLR